MLSRSLRRRVLVILRQGVQSRNLLASGVVGRMSERGCKVAMRCFSPESPAWDAAVGGAGGIVRKGHAHLDTSWRDPVRVVHSYKWRAGNYLAREVLKRIEFYATISATMRHTDVVVCSQWHKIVNAPYLKVANRHGVPVIGLQPTWDSPPPPSHFAAKFSRILGLVPEIIDDLGELGVKKDRVLVVGHPILDHYYAEKWTESDGRAFKESLGIPPSTRLVTLFDGPLPLCHPGEDAHAICNRTLEVAEWLAKAIQRGAFSEKIAVMVRPWPRRWQDHHNAPGPTPIWGEYGPDVRSRFEALIRRWPGELQLLPPRSLSLPVVGWVPTWEEDRFVARLIRSSDVVLEGGSTVAIEAAVADRPIVSFDYERLKWRPFSQKYKFKLTMLHVIWESGATTHVDSCDELVTAVQRALKYPEEGEKARETLATRFSGPQPGQSGELIERAILDLV